VTRLLARARRNPIPSLVLVLAIALSAGAGYAVAASKPKTITVCADKDTRVLHLHNKGKCKRGQTKVTWNQQGPQGVQGPAGQPGAPAVSVWANVADAGTVVAGQGISVQHVSAGIYLVTITAAACAQAINAPVISVSDSNPPAGEPAESFPTAWYGATGANQFNVFTGDVVSGTFTPSDHTFDVMDACS
jgi:hypothetical protein